MKTDIKDWLIRVLIGGIVGVVAYFAGYQDGNRQFNRHLNDMMSGGWRILDPNGSKVEHFTEQ